MCFLHIRKHAQFNRSWCQDTLWKHTQRKQKQGTRRKKVNIERRHGVVAMAAVVSMAQGAHVMTDSCDSDVIQSPHSVHRSPTAQRSRRELSGRGARGHHSGTTPVAWNITLTEKKFTLASCVIFKTIRQRE